MSDGPLTLRPRPLTGAAFAPYGDVIAAGSVEAEAMNSERFQRFDDLARLDIAGRTGLSVAHCLQPQTLPYEFRRVERHPLGSQAFMPLGRFRFVVVVARPGDPPAPSDLAAFVTDGNQGVNYHRGTWHMPLIALERGQEFLIVDRCDEGANCDTHELAGPVVLAPFPAETPG